jgi:hypothetical protein
MSFRNAWHIVLGSNKFFVTRRDHHGYGCGVDCEAAHPARQHLAVNKAVRGKRFSSGNVKREYLCGRGVFASTINSLIEGRTLDASYRF